MFPSSTAPYSDNRGFSDAVFCRQLFCARSSFGIDNLKSLLFGNSSCASIAPLLYHVCRIIPNRAKEKMLWVHARFVVAFVKHAHSFWNLAIVNQPRHSMRQSLFGGRTALSNYAVSLVLFFASPIPAAFGNISPKSLEDCAGIPLRDEELKTINLLRHVAPSLKGSMCSSLHSGDNQLQADFFSRFTNHKKERQANAAVFPRE